MKKKILLIGLAPSAVDPAALPPGMDRAKLGASLAAEEASLRELGFDAHWCLTDRGETAETVVRAELDAHAYDLILVGAGVRVFPENFVLFEKLINLIHAHAPGAKICFNTNPTDTREAVLRWIPVPEPKE